MKEYKIKYLCGCFKKLAEWQYKRDKKLISVLRCEKHGSERVHIEIKCGICGVWFATSKRSYYYCEDCHNPQLEQSRAKLRQERLQEKEQLAIIDKIFEEL